ncbi:hypothetical protein [Hoyosella altamirensis]|uniref:Uncharacterized protein n=1 Tax=Hoyosella altamirensis TaxID=616997 RepID=A0A839RV16_9ACTN|nr:hypothetical protein [Hoyosella altamirensis]MBB3040086.1 hypothetical protein [Hoyosella altamirensis]
MSPWLYALPGKPLPEEVTSAMTRVTGWLSWIIAIALIASISAAGALWWRQRNSEDITESPITRVLIGSALISAFLTAGAAGLTQILT